MDSKDTYRTLKQISKGVYREKGSKFIAIALPVYSEFEVNEQLKSIRREYHDASHWCYAFRFGNNKLIFRFNDDGEPSGTAGKPIFGQILSNDLNNVLIIVVRYFGGTRLGVSGLINAYRTAAKEALCSAEIIEKTIDDICRIDFDYQYMNDVQKILKEIKVTQQSQNYDKRCSIVFRIRKNKTDEIVSRLKKINNATVELLETL
jgi:uncharacterized YigZ family protein